MTCAWTEISNKNKTLHRDDFSKRVRDGKRERKREREREREGEREREAGMGEGKRNAHPVIPWFARRQALHSCWARAQWALYRGANQPCQAIACLIKGQERGALSANDWAENKTHSVFDWEEDFSAWTFFSPPSCAWEGKCQCLTRCLGGGIPWLIQSEVSEPEKSQYQIRRCIQAFRLKETC